jgi:hypothetical protein
MKKPVTLSRDHTMKSTLASIFVAEATKRNFFGEPPGPRRLRELVYDFVSSSTVQRLVRELEPQDGDDIAIGVSGLSGGVGDDDTGTAENQD